MCLLSSLLEYFEAKTNRVFKIISSLIFNKLTQPIGKVHPYHSTANVSHKTFECEK